MRKVFAILFVLLVGGCSAEGQTKESLMESICIVGASFAYPENGWFEMACEELNFQPLNKAISGSDIKDTAQSIKESALLTLEELDNTKSLVIMHTHNFDVFDNRGAYGSYAIAFDYVIRGYITMCKSLQYNPDSKWFGVADGKPVDIIICTHWHDGRTTFNDSVRKLDRKWDCVRLCEFDKNIGFTKDRPITKSGKQVSTSFAHPGNGATEIIDGVEYGWHPKRGRDSEIQQRMADIFCKCF